MPTEIPVWLIPLAAVAAIVALAVWLVQIYMRYRARRRIDGIITSVAYDVLKDVLVPNGMGGQIHVHYLLLTERGLLVLDVLDIPGAIFGGDQMIEWTSIGRKRRYTFANPQHVLYDRMAAVKMLAGDVPVDGRLAFTLKSEFPKGRPRYVLRIDELAEDYPPVDKNRANVVAAFADVWQNVRRHAEDNPLAA